MGELIRVEGLSTYFFAQRGVVKAVDDVSFSLAVGETLGLVGESGCGKTVTCLSILRLPPQPAGKIVGGRIVFEGEDLLQKSEKEMRQIRGSKMSMILQDPMTSLNPVFTIGSQLTEAINIHQKKLRGKRLLQKAVEMLRLVQIPAPELRLRNYPHEFSGGMRQRVVGGIALSCLPKLLIADEPTTALDVTVQTQYLELLKNIQAETRLGLIFVTHDLGIVARMCDRVAVMYAGKIVEMAGVRELFDQPCHPYTRALMKCVPKVEERVERLETIGGQPPPLYALPQGCSFSPRCKVTRGDLCVTNPPPLAKVDHDHWVSCWYHIEATDVSAAG